MVVACGGMSEGAPEAERPPSSVAAPSAEAPPPATPAPTDEAAPPGAAGGLAQQVADMREELSLSKATATWPTYQGNVQRTGWAQKAPAIREPRIRWQASVGIMGYLNGPLVLGELLVVPSSGTQHNTPDASDGLHALDAARGTERWHAKSSSDANGATLVGDLIVFTSDDGHVRGIDGSGAERWSVMRAWAVYSTPLALGSTVIVGDSSGHVVAIDAGTGKLSWEQSYKGAIRGGLASDGERVFVVSQGGDVAALDAGGREVWRKAVTRPGWNGRGTVAIEGYNAPVVDGSRLIVPFARDTYYETGPALLALSTSDGRELWRAKPGRVTESWGNLRSSPALADGLLLWAEPYSADVVTLDTSSGVVRYRMSLGDCLFPQYGSPAIAGDVAYVPRQDGHLYALDVRTGAPRWTMNLGESSKAGPVPDRSSGGGSCSWQAPSGSPLYAPPAIGDDGTIFVGSGEGVLYAIEDSTPTR